jgi:type VI secretion system protein ImpF
MVTREVRPSLLDRLLDSSVSTDSTAYFSLHELRESVQRDLQNLLNTRIRFISPDPRLKEVQDSIVNYGLPDLSSQPLNSKQGKLEFASFIERAIRRYEPRFKKVTVTPVSSEAITKGVTFRIEAVLFADPAPEDVSFDSTIDTVTQAVTLSESRP